MAIIIVSQHFSIITSLTLLYLRHLTLFVSFFTAYLAVPDLIFEHRVIGGTGAAKLISGDDMTDIDEDERDTENAKYNS